MLQIPVLLSLIISSVSLLLIPHGAFGQQSRFSLSNTPPCESFTPAAIGGPLPFHPSLLTLRWLGAANYELTHRGQVILLDAYYNRGPRNRPIGITPEQVSRADAIFIGHGHGDHMADAAFIAQRTGALVVGGPPTVEKLLSQGVPASQTRLVRGGETLPFDGFTVEAVLAHHSVLSGAVLSKFIAAITEAIGAPTPSEAAAEAAIFAKGTFDPRVITEGTIAYLFTFDSGFRFIYLDSAGPITDAERALMARIGKTDVATVAYQGHTVARNQIRETLPLVKLFNPDIYLPNHHDEIAGIFLDMGVEPLFMAIQEEMPGTKTISPLYRQPICFNLQSNAPVK